MRSSRGGRRSHVWAGRDEYKVAAILLDLPRLFHKPSPGIASLLSSSTWASKGRRSVTNVAADVVVVNNNRRSHIARTPPLLLTPSQSQHHNLPKPRRKSGSSKIKTKEKLLKRVDDLTECKEMLAREVLKVQAYYDKVSTVNSVLKAIREHELNKKCLAAKEKKKTVTKSLKNTESNAATVFPSQQPMSFMDQTPQSCKVSPPGASYSFGYAGPKMSSNELRAMDPSAWPHSFELEGSTGVVPAKKNQQAAEARRRRMNKIKCGRK